MNNFYEQFAAAAERFATRTAIEVQRRDGIDRFTYAQLRSMAECTAEFLTAHGRNSSVPRLARGERAAILADNDARWCAAYFGVLRLGGVAVPFDTAYKPKQIATLMRDSDAKVLFASQKYLSAAREALTLAGTRTELVLVDRCAPDGDDTELASLDNILTPLARETQPVDLPPCPATPADPAVILYTSGTTCDPQGVVLSHGNLLAEREAAFQVVRVDERDIVLGVLPLFHALAQMANLLLPFSIGACVVFLESVNSVELLRALRERGITLFCCVPQFFYLIHQRVTREVAAAGFVRRLAFRTLLGLNGWLRDVADINLGPLVFRQVHDVLGRSMRLLVTGGSRFDPAIGRDLYRLGFTVLQAYGLTESSGAATVTRADGKYTDSVGPPLPGVEVKILPPQIAPDSSQQVPDGEVLLRGPIVMQGYFNRSDVNAEALEGGWLHTGDLGYLDADGQLHITGRRKEIIVLSSGKNIYPEEVEAHYLQSPYIKELCVLGLARPGEPATERLHAVVVPDVDALRVRRVLNAREILRFEIEGLSIHLPSHKRILSYEIWTDELPRTTTRKLKRFEIERRVKEHASPADSVASAEGQVTEADLAWANRPEVARALELIRQAPKQPATIRPDANIELELGLDSIERVELFAALQAWFGTQVPDEVAHSIYTVRELVAACLPSQYESDAGSPARSERASPSASHGDTWGGLLQPSREANAEFAALLESRPVFGLVMFALIKLCYGFARIAFRLRVTGRENLPANGPFLLCPNHQSYIDPILLVSTLPLRILRDVFFVGASEYFATPLMRWLARKINLIPVDPDTNLLRAMQAGAFGLRHGKALILFPEGERSIDGSVKTFKKGASILSLHLRAPIVPVALEGMFEAWPRGRGPSWRYWLPGGPARVSMRFGTPLAPPGTLPAGASPAQAEARYAAETERLRAAVLEMWLSLHRQPRHTGML